jgi:hypothetical protein
MPLPNRPSVEPHLRGARSILLDVCKGKERSFFNLEYLTLLALELCKAIGSLGRSYSIFLALSLYVVIVDVN